MIETAANPPFLSDGLGRRTLRVGARGPIVAPVRRPAMRRQKTANPFSVTRFSRIRFLTRH
jgi:hypothetical protein